MPGERDPTRELTDSLGLNDFVILTEEKNLLADDIVIPSAFLARGICIEARGFSDQDGCASRQKEAGIFPSLPP